MKYRYLISLALLTLSCSKKDKPEPPAASPPPKDFREAYVGTYNASIREFVIAKGDTQYRAILTVSYNLYDSISILDVNNGYKWHAHPAIKLRTDGEAKFWQLHNEPTDSLVLAITQEGKMLHPRPDYSNFGGFNNDSINFETGDHYDMRTMHTLSLVGPKVR